jgi:transcriptional regulator with XRE-family HTH domain
MSPFARRVTEGIRFNGLTLRAFCREVGLDPSFFSKVLSGKRSAPAEEDVLRRIAQRLNLDAVELIVAAGRIPAEWGAVRQDSALFRDMDKLATGRSSRPRVQLQTLAAPRSGRPGRSPKAEPKPAFITVPRRQEMSTELL